MTARDVIYKKRQKVRFKILKKQVLLRFIKGLAAAAVASGIVYALDAITNTPGLVPPTLVPVITAALLAAQKYMKAK